MGTKDYPGELVWDQESKAVGYLLCKSPRLKRKDIIIVGKEIIGINPKMDFISLDRMFGLNQSGRRGFGGVLP